MWATLEVLEIVRSFRLMRKTHRSSHPSHHLIQIQLVFGCLSLDRLHLQLLSLPSNMLTNHKTKLHMKPKKNQIIPTKRIPPINSQPTHLHRDPRTQKCVQEMMSIPALAKPSARPQYSKVPSKQKRARSRVLRPRRSETVLDTGEGWVKKHH